MRRRKRYGESAPPPMERKRFMFRISGWCEDCEQEAQVLIMGYSRDELPPLECEHCEQEVSGDVTMLGHSGGTHESKLPRPDGEAL